MKFCLRNATDLPPAGRRAISIATLLLVASPGFAAGTAAGTVISNAATVNFELAGAPAVLTSNTVSITVVERIDVITTLQSGQVLVGGGAVDRSLLFTVTNTGNGNESFQLAINSVVAGDDFDPVPAVPPIYFDTDGSGDFSPGDTAYSPGSNDPVLAADASVDILLVNEIPPAVVNGNIGRSELIATSVTGAGAPGTVLAGQGDGGLDAVLGSSGGESIQSGEYTVADVQVDIIKAVTVNDQFGGNEPVPGATLTYAVTIEVVDAGTATVSVFNDPIPTFTSYVPNSITLNGASLTDAADGDAGELDTSGTPTVVVRLGDLTQADGVQTVEFQATID